MNSYDLSRAFVDWAFENPSKIRPIHYAVYFFAIEHCNRLGWKKEFGLPTYMAMEAIGVKKHATFASALKDLEDWGFLALVERSKNQYTANIITLSAMPKNGKALDKARAKHGEKHGQSTGQSMVTINKQENPITLEQGENGISPNFEEWKAYWDSEQKDTSHPNCRNSFLYYEEKGWRDKNGNEVKNWKNKVRNTSWWSECPLKQVNIHDPAIIAKVPDAFIEFCKAKWSCDKKESIRRWKDPQDGPTYRKIHYYPDPNLIL